MPVFEYSGFDKEKKPAKGVLEAENLKAARSKLRKMGIFPQTLKEEGKGGLSFSGDLDFSKFFRKKVKTADLAMMTRQLSTLLNAGIPLVEAISALVDQLEHPELKTVMTKIRERVTEGMKLSDAMKSHKDIFDNLYVNMVNAGEASGALDIVLARLSDFTENAAKLQSKVKSAMMYPLIMMVVGTALIVGLMVGVIPKITSIFADQGMALPIPTRIVMFISNTLSNGWFLLSAAVGIPLAVFGFLRWAKTEKGNRTIDIYSLKIPLFGKLLQMVAISRFSRTLATLLSSGVALLPSMEIVRNIVSNVVIRDVIAETASAVREGASISRPLEKSGRFPPMVIHMISIGEKTGELEKMLERVADNFDTQVDQTVASLTTLLEPVMILTMAGAVSFIVMAVLLPILQMGELEG